jgi:PAS domain S-box-containing protein
MVTYVLACSVALQLSAAVMAFRLIRLTGKRTAWSLIAVALVLMSIRRIIPLYHLLSGNSAITPDLLNELIGLVLSTLMVLGVAGITPLFSTIKRSHEDLRKNEELYRTVFENTGTATVLIGENTIIRHANAEFEKLSKCSRQEIEGKKSWTEFVVKEDLDRMRAQHLLRREKREAALKHYEFRFITKDGDIRDIFLSIDVIPGTKGSIASLLDITERKRAEDSLRASERRLREAQEMAHLGYWHWDVKTGNVEWSEEVYKIFRLNPSEFTPQIDSVLAMSPWPEDHQRDKELIGRAMDSHEQGSYEQKFLRPDKSIGHYYSTFQGNYDERGDLISIVGTVLDITERKQAEEELRESERKFRETIANLDEGFYSVTLDGVLLDHNQAFNRVLGFDETTDLTGTRLPNFWQNPKERNAYLQELTAKGSISSYQIDAKTKTGEKITILASAHFIKDRDNRPLRIEGVFLDITDRKRAEAGLRESEQKLKATVHGSPIPQFVIDRDHRVVYWNKALEEISGLKAEDMVGKDNYWSAFYKDKRPCMCDLLVDGNAESIPEWYGAQCHKSLLAADAFEVTDFFPHLGNGGKWLFFAAAPIKDSEGNIIGAVETLEDVTGRIKAEMAIHQLNAELEKRVIDRTAQLQAANKELEAFSYSVSHDLRAPLRALDGFSRILIEDYAAQLPEEAVGHLNRVRNGASHMGRLIDDLLRFSRLSRQSLEKRPVDLSPLIEEIWSTLENDREGRNVELVVGWLPDCQGDPALLTQVFHNLLGNALKYSRRTVDAKIEIGFLPQVTKAGGPPATNVYFVRDNGVGFDMQFAGKLFGVFQRLHRQEEYEGTGVGLAIVHRIIARHGGRIWAESEPDKGATFYLTIGDTQVPTVSATEKATV